MKAQAIRIAPAGGVGAEISGIDLSRPLDAEPRQAIHDVLAEHGVVFVRNQSLTPEQHIAFARQPGPINVNRFFAGLDGHPQIAMVAKEPHHTTNIGGGWHTDHSYDQIPALGSVLYAREVPPTGGDKVFASMYAAYDALSDGLKQTLAGLRAVHSSRHVFGQKREGMESRIGNPEVATQDAVHPVVIKHPVSGRRRCMPIHALRSGSRVGRIRNSDRSCHSSTPMP